MRILLPFLLSLPCLSQTIGVGVKGGVPVTQAFETSSFFTIDFGEAATSAPRRYTVGPTIELALPHRFWFELDVLYKRLGFDDLSKTAGVQFTATHATANSWEFPLLAKYRLPRFFVARPFIDGGVSFRALSGISSTSITTLGINGNPEQGPTTSSSDPHLSARSSLGVVAGVGTELKAGRLRISPELRYTHWRRDKPADLRLHSYQEQVDVLLGILF